jgi:hypothetical protein
MLTVKEQLSVWVALVPFISMKIVHIVDNGCIVHMQKFYDRFLIL